MFIDFLLHNILILFLYIYIYWYFYDILIKLKKNLEYFVIIFIKFLKRSFIIIAMIKKIYNYKWQNLRWPLYIYNKIYNIYFEYIY